jgi:CAAX protease family protein
MRILSRLRHILVSAPEWTEFWFVLFLAFGFPIYKSLTHAFTCKELKISDRSVLPVIIFDFVVLTLMAWIGKIRGWSIRQFGLYISWRLTAVGILVVALLALIFVPFSFLIHTLVPSSFYHPPPRVTNLSLATICAVSITNPLFEETLLCGYVIQRLAKCGGLLAITLSAFVRFLCHTYEGPLAVWPLAVGFVFGYIFWRYRQLWPLIVAHSLIDLVGLLHDSGRI